LIKDYYYLTKPGIIRGNLITAAAGFLFASKGDVRLDLFVETLSGITLLIASACVFNNYIDRTIDSKMSRTKQRALVTGKIKTAYALSFGVILAISAVFLLAVFTNSLTLILGLIAFINYIVFYGYSKRKSVHGTLVGTISGAMPITAGYEAVVNRIDTPAILLFFILVFWQMAHFYAIGIYRSKDYKAAGIPILPLVKGFLATKKQMIVYVLAFIVATSFLAIYGYAGKVYLVVVAASGLWWLNQSLTGLRVKKDEQWARRMFGSSLVVLLIFSIVISIDNLLP
jgi:protoheme IX farnesyltransferase